MDDGEVSSRAGGAQLPGDLSAADAKRFQRARATRYLSAAAQLDARFAAQVVEHLGVGEYRAFASSPGVDLVPVVACAHAGRQRRGARNLGLVAAFGAGALLIGVEVGAAIALFVFAWLIVAAELLYTRRSVTRSFLAGRFDPQPVIERLPRTWQRRVAELGEAQEGNVTVYSGFTPFVGAGVDIGGWSFVLNVSRGKEVLGRTAEPAPFTVAELYEKLETDLRNVGLPDLLVQDRLFVDGRDVRGDERLLDKPLSTPRARVAPEVVDQLVGNPDTAVRHYKCVHVLGWEGELVLSIFTRFARLPESLFAEASYFLLGPVKERFRKIDDVEPRARLSEIPAVLAESAVLTAGYVIASPFLLAWTLRKAAKRASRRHELRRAIERQPRFDYGAHRGLREEAAADEYLRYFQKLDKELYIKVIERQIFDTIVAFLDAKGIDTSELRDRQATVLNNGVIVAGGSVRTETLAVGERARATVRKAAQSAGAGSRAEGQRTVGT